MTKVADSSETSVNFHRLHSYTSQTKDTVWPPFREPTTTHNLRVRNSENVEVGYGPVQGMPNRRLHQTTTART
jgi:hypothetical protein